MPMKDWNLEANEDANNLNPTGDPFRAYIIEQMFTDYTDWIKQYFEIYKNSEKRN